MVQAHKIHTHAPTVHAISVSLGSLFVASSAAVEGYGAKLLAPDSPPGFRMQPKHGEAKADDLIPRDGN